MAAHPEFPAATGAEAGYDELPDDVEQLKAMLLARARLVKQKIDLENELCGLLKPFGLIVARGNVSADIFRDRVVDALCEVQDNGFNIRPLLMPLLDVHRLIPRT